jgi:hypothetical protein
VSRPIHACNLDAAFSVGAQAPCHIVWFSGDTGFTLLHPRAILAPSTSYTFTLAGGISDPSGVVNSVDHHWTITTGPAPVIRSIEPPDGATDVPVDAPISVSFSTSMAAAPTDAAIRLSPSVPDTRVVRNTLDPSRFVVLPGRTLESGVTYRLSVAATAADSHQQPLVAGVSVSFTTAGLSPGPHAVVLARASGEGATMVLLSPLAPAQPGEPIAAEAVLVAPRCESLPRCGAAALGAPLYTYTEAVLSPGGRWLAVVEFDGTVATPQPVMVVLNAATGSVLASFTHSSMPSWSPDGSTLAFSRSGLVSLFAIGTGAVTDLPAGDSPVAPAVWNPLGEQLVLNVAGPTDIEQLELADAVVLARYPVPGITGDCTDPVITPDGTQLAFERSTPTARGTWIAGIGAAPSPPRLLDATLVPLGFTATGTLVGIRTPAAGLPALVLVSVAGDEQIAIPNGPAPGWLTTVVVAPSGRQLVYLSPDAAGVVQAYVENADGSNPRLITGFAQDTLDATAVTVSG